MALKTTETASAESAITSHDRDARQQLLLLGASAWLTVGAYIDGRAHETQPGLESFFTPWHAILYSGFLAAAIVVGVAALNSLRRTGSLTDGMPTGWGLSLLGVGLFSAGGVSDMLWHIVFGIEVNVEALLSPTHLLLSIGGALILTGPLRAAWRGTGDTLPWTAAVSAALLLASISFMTIYAQPFGYVYAGRIPPPRSDVSPITGQVIGVSSILWNSALITGLLLLLVRRFRVPVGFGTLLVLSHVVLLGFMEAFGWLVPAGLAAGIALDLLLVRLGDGTPRNTRLLGLTAPAVLYAPYFLAVALAVGLGWSVPLWTGSIVVAALVGLMISYVAAPPEHPAAHGRTLTAD